MNFMNFFKPSLNFAIGLVFFVKFIEYNEDVDKSIKNLEEINSLLDTNIKLVSILKVLTEREQEQERKIEKERSYLK